MLQNIDLLFALAIGAPSCVWASAWLVRELRRLSLVSRNAQALLDSDGKLRSPRYLAALERHSELLGGDPGCQPTLLIVRLFPLSGARKRSGGAGELKPPAPPVSESPTKPAPP